MDIDFGQWLPDLPLLNNPGCTDAVNVNPTTNGYRYMSNADQVSTTGMTAYPRGAFNGLFNNTSVIFLGDATKLYSLTGISVALNDDSGATYAAGSFWDFTQFGSLVIAVNGGASGNDAPVVWDMSSDVPGTDNWANLGGSPPNAACCTVVRDFVVLGHTYDATDGEVEDRVRWSGITNATSWAISAATQADFQDLNTGGGAVQRITGGDVGIIYQERSITRMTYEGPPTIFRFDEIYKGLGTPAPMSVVQANGIDYLWSTIGFISIDRNGGMTPIGSQRVDRYFRSQLGSGQEANIIGMHDSANDSIVWLYGAAPSSNTKTAIGYNYKLDKWFRISVDTDLRNSAYFADIRYLFAAQLGSQPEQTLYGITGSASATVYGVAAFINSLDSIKGRITSREYELFPNNRALAGRVRPAFTSTGGATFNVFVDSRNFQSDASPGGVTSTQLTKETISNEYTGLVNARYQRLRVEMVGADYTIDSAALMDVQKGGRF